MLSSELRKKYKPTIGIECHVQLKTNTKLFAAVSNDARTAKPNTLISHICMGLPGALPVLNKQAVKLAIRAALAFQTEPAVLSVFERKHYFYPDLPMGYQISQLKQPIILGGKIEISVGGKVKYINLTRSQLEADAGKSIHNKGNDFSLVDLNRAGTPLLEIVSEPEIHTAEEAKAYAKELFLLVRYAGISDADLFHGNMRFDINVSVSTSEKNLGTRSETKNINSFKSVEKTVLYEIDRQIKLLERGEQVVQETRGWDDDKQKTFSQRNKEDAHDYRYFPDPDLPPVIITNDDVKSVKSMMPTLPFEWRAKLVNAGLDYKIINVLLDAEIEFEGSGYLTLIENDLDNKDYIKTLSNWFVNVEIPLRRKQGEVTYRYDDVEKNNFYKKLYSLVKQDKLSSTNAKALITVIVNTGVKPKDIEKYAMEQGLLQVSDSGALKKIVKSVIATNEQASNDVRNGEMKAVGFLVGQVMKRSEGKANPAVVRDLISKFLT